jgi:hypothetical protein
MQTLDSCFTAVFSEIFRSISGRLHLCYLSNLDAMKQKRCRLLSSSAHMMFDALAWVLKLGSRRPLRSYCSRNAERYSP